MQGEQNTGKAPIGVVDWAQTYRERGRVVLPIPAGTKRAEVERWSDPTVTEFTVSDADNIAWRLDGVVDLDLDNPLAIAMASSLVPPAGAMSGRPSANGPGHYYYLGSELGYEKFALPGVGTILEIRTGPTHYTVAPPSLMPASKGLPAERSIWYKWGELTAPDPIGLRRSAQLLVTAVGLASLLGKWGFGHDARLEVAGFLLRLGLSQDEATAVGLAISGPCENDEVKDVAVSVKSTASRLKAGDKEVSGGPSLARRLGDHGDAMIRALAKLFGQGTETQHFAWTESGDAETFALLNADTVRYDHRRGRWLLFQNHGWRPQSDGEIDRLALEAVRRRQRDAMMTENSDLRTAQLKWAIGGESRTRRANLLELAKSVKPISDDGKRWDLEPWLLGAPNGVVDLRTGELRPGRPEDRITMQVRYSYDRDAKAPLWEATVLEIFCGDAELVRYVQRFLGYSILPDCREEVLAVCYGDGANGKGTLMNTVSWVMSEYADDLPFTAFELSNRSGIPNDIAKIDGKRFVTSSETGETQRLNESRIKALTGRDPITARFLHQEFFTFQPVSKFWLATNHKPDIRDDSAGFWRRIHLIPFLASFAGREDKTLKDRLRLEGIGILSWLVQGALAWQAMGLQPPAKVSEATKEWKDESDLLAPFFEDRCVMAPGARVGSTALHEEYKRWAGVSGIRDPLSQKAFGTRLRKQFVVEEGRHVKYIGIGLRDPHGNEEGPEI